MDDNDKFMVAFLWIVSLITALLIGMLAIGLPTGQGNARNLICTEAGYDSHRQVGNSTYCYRGVGKDMVFVLVGPLEEVE